MKRFSCTAMMGLAFLVSGCLATTQAAEKISYVTAGGVYLENIKKAFLEPIGKKLDVEWTIETADNDTQVRVQARAGASTYDIVEFGASQCARGGKDGLYEKLDFSMIDVKDFAPGSYGDYYLGSTLFAIVVGWNKKLGDNAPSNWAEFWDVKKFPGTRSLRKTARYTLEAALMADGVEPSKLYPMDLDRAIASLRKIKPSIKAWWLSGAESQQLVKDGGIEMIGAFNARLELGRGRRRAHHLYVQSRYPRFRLLGDREGHQEEGPGHEDSGRVRQARIPGRDGSPLQLWGRQSEDTGDRQDHAGGRREASERPRASEKAGSDQCRLVGGEWRARDRAVRSIHERVIAESR